MRVLAAINFQLAGWALCSLYRGVNDPEVVAFLALVHICVGYVALNGASK